MKEYKVLRNNYGYKGRYWEEGKIVKFEDDDKPSHHFQLLDEWKETSEGKKAERSDPQKPIPYLPGKYPLTEKRGFASSLDSTPPQEPVTAGKALKDRK